MGIFDLFKRTSHSSKESIKKEYVGNMVHITFPTSNGSFTIKAKSVDGIGESKGVVYDCFIVAINQWQKQGMGENDFIHDMEKVVNMVSNGIDNKNVMKTLLNQHIAQSGRLIDTDLCTYISELYLAIIAIKGNCDRDILLDQMMQVAEHEFSKYIYITQYKRSASGLQPYLVSFADFVNNSDI